MLKRFRVGNWRSLVNVEFKPTGLDLLIGANNAGKTNLCAALRFLGLTATLPVGVAARYAVGETANLANVYVSDRTVELEAECVLPFEGAELHFCYRLELSADANGRTSPAPLRVTEETLTASGGSFPETLLVELREGSGRLLNEAQLIRGEADPYARTPGGPTDTTLLRQLHDLPENRRAFTLKRHLQSWRYFHLSGDALRSPDGDDAELGPDGRGFARALFALHNEDPRLERTLIEAVRALEPRLDLLAYATPDRESVFLFMEDPERHRFGMRSISDGTLRFMAMTYLILANAERAKQGDPAPLTIIEEPENGLFVGHLKPLFQRIDPQGGGGQFIFTTHSPYFIDLFDDHLDGVHVLRPGKPSSVLVRPDPAKVRALLDQMPLGEMHFREMLG